MKDNKIRMSLTKDEIYLIYSVLNRTLEMLGGDDRPDHGLAQLELIWSDEEARSRMFHLMGRFWRRR